MSAQIPSPAPREREGPPKGEGEGRAAPQAGWRLRASPSSGSLRSPPSPAVQEKGLLAQLGKDAFEIGLDLVAPEAQDAPAGSFQLGCPFGVASVFRVLSAIGLDDQHALSADEVSNIGLDRMLTAEFETAQAPAAQGRPQEVFRVCRGLAHFAGERVSHSTENSLKQVVRQSPLLRRGRGRGPAKAGRARGVPLLRPRGAYAPHPHPARYARHLLPQCRRREWSASRLIELPFPSTFERPRPE